MKKECLCCGRIFETTRANKKYCSNYCCDKYNHERYMREGITNKHDTERKRKKKLEANAKKRKLSRFDEIAKIQSETGIGYGKLAPIWDDKVKLAEYIKLHRTR